MRRFLVAMAVAGALGLLAVPSALALDEVGNPCVADESQPGWTAIGLSNQGATPFIQPQVFSAGVITRWKVQVAPGKGPLAQQLVVLAQVGEEDDRKLAESALETVGAGSNEFLTRIPVAENTHVGLAGPAETFVCAAQALNTTGVVQGPFASGETRHFEVKVGVGTPVVAIVEPDRDGDGYGDETQDACPASGLYHEECPQVTPGVRFVKVKRQAVQIEVNVSSQATVQVFGQVSWQPRQAAGNRRLTVALSGSGPRKVGPGTYADFRLPLPRSVLRRLGRIPPRQSLRSRITIRTIDLAGRETDRWLTVRLPGRER